MGGDGLLLVLARHELDRPHRAPLSSTDPRQRIAHELVHHPLAAEGRLHQHHPRRLRPHLADLRRALAAGRARMASRAASAASGATAATSTPSLATYMGSMPEDLGGAPHRRLHRHVRLAHDHRHAARRAPARSAPTPRRRGWRRAGSAARPRRHPAARRPSATASACRTRSSASSSNSPRASMIAMPCSPTGPETSIRSPGRSASGDSAARGSTPPEPGRGDVHRVGVAALDDLGVAGHHLDAGALRGRGDRLDLGARSSAARPSSSISDERQRERPGPGDGQVVDGAVDGEVADRAAGEADRLDHEAVSGHRELGAAHRDDAGVAQRVERGRAKAGASSPSISVWRRLAARAVGHRDRAGRGTSPAWSAPSR